MYKLILDPNAPIELDEIQEYDSSVYNSLKYILDNTIDEDEYLEMYFQHEFNGKMYPLVQDGANIRVTDENKENYVALKVDFMVKNFILPQTYAILKGFQKLIPLELIKSFKAEEFEYLI